MKKLLNRFSILLAVIIACSFIIEGGCSSLGGEGFAIYLTRDDIPPAKMEMLSHIDLAVQPVISLNDIVSYDPETHEITLTASAFDRVSNLDVPVRGKSFVVCVDGKPVYWGAFWTPLSSFSFDGITIWISKPPASDGSKVIKLSLGYPSPSFYKGEDPRNNAGIMESLASAGKLITKSEPAKGKLPHSMKGYELYSWQQDGQWHFTLMTGTNRNKTLEEIISNVSIVDDGWVHIHVIGQDAVNSVLSRLPQNEEIFWLSCSRTGQTAQSDIDIALPPKTITAFIKDHAEKCGLKLTMAQDE